MASEDLISVIMPCFDAAPYVEEAVRSALDQSHIVVEVVVVDDGSTDGSQQIIERLAEENPGRIQYFRQDRRGPFPARNLGLRHAKGRFVAFLDADDYWHPECLEKLHRALVDANADCSYCGWQNIGKDRSNSTPYVPSEYEKGDPVMSFLESCPWPIHAALVRREVLNRLNGFSERCYSAMDYDLWLRLIGETRQIVRVPEVLAFYRWHGSTQISAVKWRQTMDAFRARTDFVRTNHPLVSHLPRKALAHLVEGDLSRAAFRAYWARDLDSAHRLFRESLKHGAWRLADLKYMLPALMPYSVFSRIVLALGGSSGGGDSTNAGV